MKADEWTERVKHIAESLSQCPQVIATAQRKGESVEEVGWEAAISIMDIVESAEAISQRWVPQLLAASSPSGREDALHEIGEQFRHILYHVTHTSVFEHLAVLADDRE